MIVVRYATLVALVIWLGAMVGQRYGGGFHHAHLVGYACGAAMVVGLFALKFLGPPPGSRRATAINSSASIEYGRRPVTSNAVSSAEAPRT